MPIYDVAMSLKRTLVAHATDGHGDGHVFVIARKRLIEDSAVSNLVPRWLKSIRSLDEFWPFIKEKFATYAERRQYLASEFDKLLARLEESELSPIDDSVNSILSVVDSGHVKLAWNKALSRKSDDPEGAITSARELLETICKHILHDAGESDLDVHDLPKLYKLASTELNLAPDQHGERVFKQILGGCASVVQGLGTLRSRFGDAHGKGPLAKRPTDRHAALAVNLAGAMALFLIQTWEVRKTVKN